MKHSFGLLYEIQTVKQETWFDRLNRKCGQLVERNIEIVVALIVGSILLVAFVG